MGHWTWKNSELVALSLGQVGGAGGGFAISKFRGTPEKIHETCQNATLLQLTFPFKKIY